MAAIAIVPLVTKTISLGKNTTFTVLIVQGLHIRISLIYICLFITDLPELSHKVHLC